MRRRTPLVELLALHLWWLAVENVDGRDSVLEHSAGPVEEALQVAAADQESQVERDEDAVRGIKGGKQGESTPRREVKYLRK